MAIGAMRRAKRNQFSMVVVVAVAVAVIVSAVAVDVAVAIPTGIVVAFSVTAGRLGAPNLRFGR